jgi:HAD superfamily hydrolase (TIGR01509 family)
MDVVAGIGFDLDHTLAIDNGLERVAFLHLLGVVLGEGGQSVGTFGDELACIDGVLEHQRAGEFSIEEAVRRFVAAHGVEPQESHVRYFRQMAVNMVGEFVVPLPGVGSMLEALRVRGIEVAVLSNGWNPLQAQKAQAAGFAGRVLVSSELGVQKPAQAAFTALVTALGTAPEQTWYVGDDPRSDVAGAHAAGLRAIWINWERKPFPAELRPPDRTIEEFEELLQSLPSPAKIF